MKETTVTGFEMAVLLSAEKIETGVVVKHAAGFAPAFEFVAEATTQVGDGFVTVTEGGHSAAGAAARVKSAVAHKMSARKRACGFTADGFKCDCTKAAFGVGFA